MEFNEKLYELRKKKGLTQQELAQTLFVSRTAVSKWESGRGYPSIDSLRTMAKFFGITVDELLSADELLEVAREDSRQKEKRIRDLLFGLLDCSLALLMWLPFFGQRSDGAVKEVSLMFIDGIAPYLKIVYFALVISIIVTGIATLALQNCQHSVWLRSKSKISIVLSVLGVILFIAGMQPYAAAFLFVFLMIKVMLLVKWQ